MPPPLAPWTIADETGLLEDGSLRSLQHRVVKKEGPQEKRNKMGFRVEVLWLGRREGRWGGGARFLCVLFVAGARPSSPAVTMLGPHNPGLFVIIYLSSRDMWGMVSSPARGV